MTKLTVSGGGTRLEWDVVQVDKRPTRLPESTFFTFNPVVPARPAYQETPRLGLCSARS